MNRIDTKGVLLRIFTPTLILSVVYFIVGHFCKIPQLLLFCILGTIILVPIELGIILYAGKKEYGTYTLKSAFAGQEKIAVWKIIIIAFVFFGITGLLSALIAPIENKIFAEIRSAVLNFLPIGFDWTNFEYV